MNAISRISLCIALLVTVSLESAMALGSDPKPRLYPNAHLKKVGQTQANKDIAECSSAAAEYVSSSKERGDGVRSGVRAAAKGAALGTVGGAIAGNTGRGAAAGAAIGGTASVIKGVKERGARDPAFQQYASSCLEDKGYKVVEWK